MYIYMYMHTYTLIAAEAALQQKATTLQEDAEALAALDEEVVAVVCRVLQWCVAVVCCSSVLRCRKMRRLLLPWTRRLLQSCVMCRSSVLQWCVAVVCCSSVLQ